MLIIGLILILVAAAVIGYMVFATAGMEPVEISYGVLNVMLQPLWLFLLGVVTLLVAAIGVWMAVAGIRNQARRSREVRDLRKQAKEADRRAVRTSDADRPGERAAATSTTLREPTPTGQTGTSAPRSPSTGQTDTTAPERNRLEPDR